MHCYKPCSSASRSFFLEFKNCKMHYIHQIWINLGWDLPVCSILLLALDSRAVRVRAGAPSDLLTPRHWWRGVRYFPTYPPPKPPIPLKFFSQIFPNPWNPLAHSAPLNISRIIFYIGLPFACSPNIKNPWITSLAATRLNEICLSLPVPLLN